MLSFLVLAVIVILIAGVLLWGLKQLPLDETLKIVAKVVIVCGVVIWLLWEVYQRFGK